MTVKNVVIPVEVEYLQRAARERGISRSKLVRIVMQKIVSDELVCDILGDQTLADVEPTLRRYRRFHNRQHRR